MKTNLIWATPRIDETIAYIARVSNQKHQDKPIGNILRYMLEHGHFSPFEMANACIEIETTRDIARQVLRHRSFSFQEFSQRYANVNELPPPKLRECRLQDFQNRQNSLPTDDAYLRNQWAELQNDVIRNSRAVYDKAISLGIAKEQARVVLPEGLTPSRLYMNGSVRSWIHYLKLRLDESTQLEHRILASEIKIIMMDVAPETFGAAL